MIISLIFVCIILGGLIWFYFFYGVALICELFFGYDIYETISDIDYKYKIGALHLILTIIMLYLILLKAHYG